MRLLACRNGRSRFIVRRRTISLLFVAGLRNLLLGIRRETLQLGLLVPQARICAIATQQLIVRTALRNAAVSQNIDAVSLGNRRQTVRDYDNGARACQLVNDADNGLLAFRVHIRRCLVENVDGRVVQKRSRKR